MNESVLLDRAIEPPLGQASIHRGRWEFLDAVRGIAAILVVVQHTIEANPINYQFLVRYFNFGEIGVVGFFLVSGFIIPASIERHGSQSRFWIGRAYRLLPVYWVNFATVLAVGWVMSTLSPVLFTHPARYLAGNLAMISEILRVPAGEGAYWTLQYELLFYVIASLLFVTSLLRRSALWACVAVLVYLFSNLVLVLTIHRALSAEKMGVLAAAFVGTLIYRYSQGHQSLRHIWLSLVIMAVAVISTSWFRLGAFRAGGEELMTPFCTDCSFLLGYLLFGLPFLLRAKSFPGALLWLGKISYSVYIWHPLVLRFVPRAMPVGERTVLVLGTTIPLAFVSYRLLEVPAQAIYKRTVRVHLPDKETTTLLPHVSQHPAF